MTDEKVSRNVKEFSAFFFFTFTMYVSISIGVAAITYFYSEFDSTCQYVGILISGILIISAFVCWRYNRKKLERVKKMPNKRAEIQKDEKRCTVVFLIYILLFIVATYIFRKCNVFNYLSCQKNINSPQYQIEKLYADFLITLITFLGVLLGSLIVSLSVVVRGFQERYLKAEEKYENDKMLESKKKMDEIEEYWKFFIKSSSIFLFMLGILIFLFIIFLIIPRTYFLSFSFSISAFMTYFSIDIITDDFYKNSFSKA